MSKEITITLELPHEAQKSVLKQAKRFNVVNCGRRWGKSKLAKKLLTEPALEGYEVGYFTPTYKFLEATYNDCLNTLSQLVKSKHQNQHIELITGGRIDFWTLENPLAGRSRKYKRIVIDEAAFVKNLFERFTEALRATLTDYKGDAWIFSTPYGKNDFFKLYNKAIQGDEDWASFHMPTSANPYIDPLEIEDARRDMPEDVFKREYLGLFLDDSICIFRNIHQRINMKYQKGTRHFIGVDVGRINDNTVVTVLNEKCQMVYQGAIRQKEWHEITSWCVNKIKRYAPHQIAVESNGIGDTLEGALRKEIGNSVYGVTVTAHNKQTLIEDLVLAFDNGEISILDDEKLINELEIFTFIFDHKTRKVKYSAPEKMHDDRVMSLAHAYNCYKTKRSYGQY